VHVEEQVVLAANPRAGPRLAGAIAARARSLWHLEIPIVADVVQYAAALGIYFSVARDHRELPPAPRVMGLQRPGPNRERKDYSLQDQQLFETRSARVSEEERGAISPRGYRWIANDRDLCDSAQPRLMRLFRWRWRFRSGADHRKARGSWSRERCGFERLTERHLLPLSRTYRALAHMHVDSLTR
jgi:hypothetical protein